MDWTSPHGIALGTFAVCVLVFLGSCIRVIQKISAYAERLEQRDERMQEHVADAIAATRRLAETFETHRIDYAGTKVKVEHLEDDVKLLQDDVRKTGRHRE